MAEPRDDKVSAAFRAMPPLEPPPALDDAIRAAARRAVKAKPETALRRWAVPASVPTVSTPDAKKRSFTSGACSVRAAS